MPSSTSANMLTLVHASSSGVTQWFPDACKTPSPAGPVPIPYPNIAMSSDTADGSTTVKVDGNPIMLQGSNFKMSSGDEAGAAMGVASNKIKGKAEPVNQSMDVKVDGKGVFRLTDPMTHNAGSTPNGGGLPVVQPPNPTIPTQNEACKKTKEKKKEQQAASTSWGDCGILGAHRGPIQAVATEQQVIIYFRRTKPECAKWIGAKHMPKPHSVLAGTTIVGGKTKKTQAWLDQHFRRMDPLERRVYPRFTSLMGTNLTYSRRGRDYIGIVGVTEDGVDLGKPLKGFGTGMSGSDYDGKWITGDYDLFQVLNAGFKCQETCERGSKFAQIQTEINKRIKWDAIQHGPQAQWAPKEGELDPDVELFDMRQVLKGALRGDMSKLKVQITAGETPRSLNTLDTNVTVVAGDGAMTLKDEQDLVDSLICQECDK
ncbi:MAG: DUF4150 domain-containing protein [Candidatus Eisenbacteria bacterium]